MNENTTSLEDIRWLTGPDAVDALDFAAEDERTQTTATIKALRAGLSPERTHLVMEQATLRRKGLEKFAAAGRMFFTTIGLQQSSGQLVASYKAARFPSDASVIDYCCGIGGDLIDLGIRGPTVGVERDPVAATIAEANARVLGLESQIKIRVADVRDVPPEDADAWHIDPDRRVAGLRTTRPELHDPPPEVIENLLKTNPNGAIKLAPAAAPPAGWDYRAELEWISDTRECRQLVAWFGSLAMHKEKRTATILSEHHDPRTIIGTSDGPGSPIGNLGKYLFEPRPAVIAARLTDTLAAQYGLKRIARGVAYLSEAETIDASCNSDGYTPFTDPALAPFEIIEQLPFDIKRIKRVLQNHDVGRLEIKKRVVDISPETLRRKLRTKGDTPAVLILSPHAGNIIALLCRRVEETPLA